MSVGNAESAAHTHAEKESMGLGVPKRKYFTKYSGPFTGRDRPDAPILPGGSQISRVEWGRVRRCLKSYGTGRFGSGRVRVGSGQEVFNLAGRDRLP